MIIKQKPLILHNDVTSKISSKTGEKIYLLSVRDPLDDEISTIYSYEKGFDGMKAKTEIVVDLQLVSIIDDGKAEIYLRTVENKTK